jgi:hypothetical protein
MATTTRVYSTDRRATAARRRRERERAEGIVPLQIALPAREKAILESIAMIDRRTESDVVLEILAAGLRALRGKTLQLALGEFDQAS